MRVICNVAIVQLKPLDSVKPHLSLDLLTKMVREYWYRVGAKAIYVG